MRLTIALSIAILTLPTTITVAQSAQSSTSKAGVNSTAFKHAYKTNTRSGSSTKWQVDRKKPLNMGCTQHFSPSNGGGCSY